MIRNLEISNFQSHKNSVLEFDEGVSVITGPSDSGKSAIFKALLWAINNRPLGDEFKSWFAKEKDTVNVGIEFSEGTYVAKERKGAKNIYDLNGTIFEALKSDVPDELKKLTNLVDYNIQFQHQPYFLLQDTPGEVARKFNDWVGLDIIDRAFSKINSIVSISKGKIADYDNEITRLTAQVESLSYIDKIQVILDELETLYSEKEKIENICLSIEKTVSSIDKLQEEISELLYDENLEKEVQSILKLIASLEQKQKKTIDLEKLILSIEKTEKEVKEESGWLEVETNYLEVNELISTFKANQSKVKNLISAVSNIETTNKSIANEELKHKNLLAERKIQLKKITLCPVCQLPVTEQSLLCILEYDK